MEHRWICLVNSCVWERFVWSEALRARVCHSSVARIGVAHEQLYFASIGALKGSRLHMFHCLHTWMQQVTRHCHTNKHKTIPLNASRPKEYFQPALSNISYLVFPAWEHPTNTTFRNWKDLNEAPVSLASFTSLRYVFTASHPFSTTASGGIRHGLSLRRTDLTDWKWVASFKASSTLPKPVRRKRGGKYKH